MSTAPTTKHSSWVYAEQHAGEGKLFETARGQAAELGSSTVTEGTAAALTALSAAGHAKGIVEIGTGVGISGAALLRGSPEAVLTTIDAEPDHSAAARRLFQREGFASSRIRLITGRAEQVLPRLTAQGYDMVLVDTGPVTAGDFALQSIRLLRTGGMLIINDALDDDRVPKPAIREQGTQAMRALERALLEDERLTTALFPTGTGLLLAVRVR